MTIKNGDFVELNYTGKLKESGLVFDTTDPTVAAANGLSQKHKYVPVVIIVGEKHLVKGLDDFLAGKEPGKYTVELKDIDAFGKKSAKLLMMVPVKRFKEQKIEPYPGLEINIDGAYGVVKTVSGGRIIVDFNHPLASQDIIYDLEVRKILTDTVEKINSLGTMLGVSVKNVSIAEGNVSIEYNDDITQEMKDFFIKEVEKFTDAKVKP
jgi:FKBP-type peptidyl-prolyl cis-trans isomerase 2